MQMDRLFFQKLLVGIVCVSFYPGFSLAASSPKGDTVGFCCTRHVLKESTAKECQKKRGTFYLVKEKVKAQKECRSKKPAPSGEVVAPAKTEVSIFCCANGVVKKTTKAQCMKKKGKYYANSAQAQRDCQVKKLFCCVDRKIKETSARQCKQHKGTAYKSAAEARKKCKPANIFCCVDGKIKETSARQCKQHKGTAYKSAAEARKKCKPANVFCCVDGKIKETSSRQCKQQKGTAYKSAAEARRKCKPANVFCCVDGKIKETSSRQCKQHKGTAYKSAAEARKKCKSAKILCCVNGKVRQLSSQECNKNKGTSYANINEAKKKCRVEDVFCCTDGKISKVSSRQCRSKKGRAYKTRTKAEKECKTDVTKPGILGHSLPASTLMKPVKPRATKPHIETTMDRRPTSARNNPRAVHDTRRAATEILPTQKYCNVTGKVFVDGEIPWTPINMKLRLQNGTGPSPIGYTPKDFRLSRDGSFSFQVPHSTRSYLLQPFFEEEARYGESMPAKEFICWMEIADDVNLNFNYDSPRLDCKLDGKKVAHGESRTFYSRDIGNEEECNNYGIERVCDNGVLSGESLYAHARCENGCRQYGVTVRPGHTRTFYSTKLVVDRRNRDVRQTCASFERRRTCRGGRLSGSDEYRYLTCEEEYGNDCTLGRIRIREGHTIELYARLIAPTESLCESSRGTRVCLGGRLRGSSNYRFPHCGVTGSN